MAKKALFEETIIGKYNDVGENHYEPTIKKEDESQNLSFEISQFLKRYSDKKVKITYTISFEEV